MKFLINETHTAIPNREYEAIEAIIVAATNILWEETVNGPWIVGKHSGIRLQNAIARLREVENESQSSIG